MKLLLSFVNSPLALAGYDWNRGELFWTLAADCLRACGICYHGRDLLVASDDAVVRLTANGTTFIPLPAPHPNLAHSIHPLDAEHVGVIDTGNSTLRVLTRSGCLFDRFSPVADWPSVPQDAIHLNDYAVTPHGIVASAFDYRPWRAARERMIWEEWCRGGFGVLIALSDRAGNQHGRLIGCGLDHPHSLVYAHERLYHCSLATGQFHRWRWDRDGSLRPEQSWKITGEHFLRGACQIGQTWFLGGSTTRHGERFCDQAAVYHFEEGTAHLEQKQLPLAGEIYDILPWREELLAPILPRLNPL